MILQSCSAYSLRDMALAHGWIALPPWSWCAEPPTLRRVERLPSGCVVAIEVTCAEPQEPTDRFVVRGAGSLAAADREVVERRLRWILPTASGVEMSSDVPRELADAVIGGLLAGSSAPSVENASPAEASATDGLATAR